MRGKKPRLSLSQAMLKGASMTPQCFGHWHQTVGGVVETCALGAADHALGCGPSRLFKRFPELEEPWCGTLPCGCPAWEGSLSLYRVITHLNDGHQWRRETIAQWLASLERK